MAVAGDQRQIETEFRGLETLRLDEATEADVTQVEKTFRELDRLEGEVSGTSDSTGGDNETLGA